MTITVVEPRTAAPPGYGRAYASVPVQISRQGVLRPASLAQWRPFVPGTDDQYTGPLFGDAYSETPLSFPQRADERGLIEVWAPEPVRIEVGAWIDGYTPVRQVLDLLFTEDFSQDRGDDLYLPLSHEPGTNPHPQYLTQDEGNLLYLPVSYVPPASGISQTDADLRYVNTAGDIMSGYLLLQDNLYLSSPSGTPTSISLRSNSLNRWILQVADAETGSNAGSNFLLHRYADDQTYLGLALGITRATGAATFGGALNVNGNANFVGHVEVAGSLYGYGVSHLAVLNVASKPVAVSPTAGNALTWDATGLYAPAGGGGGLDIATGDARYVNTAGDVMTGALTVVGDVVVDSGGYIVSGAAGTGRALKLWTSGVPRWEVIATAAAETGSNAGSDLWFQRYSDAGSLLGTSLSLSRATGAATFGGPVTIQRVGAGARLGLDAQAGFSRDVLFSTYPGTPRWLFGANGVSEAGSNTGSDFTVTRYDDAGNPLGTFLTGNRATGAATFEGDVSIGGNADVTLSRNGASNLRVNANLAPTTSMARTLGTSALRWSDVYANGYTASTCVTIGSPTPATGAIRLGNTQNIAWRNAANNANLTLGMDASDRLALAVGAGSLTTSATAGGATALPATPTGYLTVVLNGSTVKVPYYS